MKSFGYVRIIKQNWWCLERDIVRFNYWEAILFEMNKRLIWNLSQQHRSRVTKMKINDNLKLSQDFLLVSFPFCFENLRVTFFIKTVFFPIMTALRGPW